MSCPPFEALLAWRSGQDISAHDAPSEAATTPEDEAITAVNGHLQGGCPGCRRRLQLLDQLLISLNEPAPPMVPAALRRRVLDQLHALPQEGSSAAGAGPLGRLVGQLQEFIAELVQPLGSQALAAGLRGENDPALHRFRAGDYLLDVGLVERRAVLGQLLDQDGLDAEDFDGAAAILCGADGSQQASLDEDGAFRFDRTGPGRFALLIESPTVRLVFPDIDLTAPGD